MAWNKDEHDFYTRAPGTYWGEEGKKIDKMFEYNPTAGLPRPSSPGSSRGNSKPLFPAVDAFFDSIPGWIAGVFVVLGLLIGAVALSQNPIVGGIVGAIAGGLLLPIMRLGVKALLIAISIAIVGGILFLVLKIIGLFAG